MRHSPDVIFYNATVITIDPKKPRAGLAAVKGERIVYVGEASELPRLKGPDTRVIDCQGGAVVPGFHDAHAHLPGLAVRLLSVDCTPRHIRSITALKDAVAQRARALPSGKWVRGWGYSEYYMKEKRHPNRYDLDEAAPGNPVCIKHRSGHGLVLNTQGLKLIGITRDKPDPVDGVIERDEHGEPTGVLWEMNYEVDAKLPRFPQKELESGTREASRLMLSQGFTSAQDATLDNNLWRWGQWQKTKASGIFALRVVVMPGISHLEEFLEAGLRPEQGEMELRIGPVKLMPLLTTGTLQPTVQELMAQVLSAHKNGFQVAIHAIDDEVVSEAARAIGYALRQLPRKDSRHRIEHCAECPPKVKAQIKSAQAVVVTNPNFVYSSGDRYLAQVEKRKRRWLYSVAGHRDAGIPVAFATDTPVEMPSALEGIYAAVTRKSASGKVLNLEEAVSVEEALRMHTWAGAYSCFWDRKLGSIEPGKLADLVVLDRDPTMIGAEEILQVKVLLTMLGGQVVWER